MTLSVLERAAPEVEHALSRALNCPRTSDAVQRTLAAEHIRALAYPGSLAVVGRGRRIHTTRLLGSVRRNLQGLWPTSRRIVDGTSIDEADDPYRQVLTSLSAIGDLADLGGGFWTTAPLRLVETPDLEHFVVVGGAPLEVVETLLVARVQSAGAGRFVRRAGVTLSAVAQDTIQSVENWLGYPESLAAWTDRAISFYRDRLSSSQETGADALEIYAPDIYRDRRRQGRWMPAIEIRNPLPELRLCRPHSARGRNYNTPYYLGDFEYHSGALFLRRSVQVTHEVSRRLRFGLDEKLRAPRAAGLSSGGDLCVLDLPYALPEPESRVLALGWTPSNAKLRALHYFHVAAKPLLAWVCQRLSIRLTDGLES